MRTELASSAKLTIRINEGVSQGTLSIFLYTTGIQLDCFYRSILVILIFWGAPFLENTKSQNCYFL